MIQVVNALDAPLQPLNAYKNEDSFKVYLSDTGMLRSMCGIHYRDLLASSNNVYKGVLTENYVVQQFAAAGHMLYYFKPSEAMEIDLVTEIDEEIIPVEIRAGRHKRSTSLKNYMQRYDPVCAIRISELNFGWSEKLISLPLYAVWLL